MSIAWWIHNAFGRSAAIGWNTLQIFTKSPRWRSIPVIDDEELSLCFREREIHGQVWGLVHSNYLANLSWTLDETKQALDSIKHDFMIAHHTWFEAVNVHVWKLKWRASLDEAMTNMVKNLELILKHNKDNNYTPLFLFENTAGQWSEIGSTLDELGYFYQNYLKDLPVKFCMDTAHCRWWGIDLRNWESVLAEFDEKIGLDNFYSVHLNDAKVPLWSNLDRHAPMGKWFIGWPVIRPIVERASNTWRKLYLETKNPDLWPEEIQKITRITAGDTDRINQEHQQEFRSDVLKKFEDYVETVWLF